MPSNLQSPAYKIFLRELIALRKRCGLTQTEVAQRLGKAQSFISKSERGERRIDPVELVLIARALDVRAEEITALAEEAVCEVEK